MLNRKLLEIINRLEHQTIKRLQQFLQSPYFTQGLSSREIVKLFSYLILHRGGAHSDALDKRIVSMALFPEKPFLENHKNPIDTLTTDLLRLIKLFIFVESQMEEQPKAIKELPVAKFYMENGLDDRFRQIIEPARQSLIDQPKHDEMYYLRLFQLEGELAHYETLYNSFQDDAHLGVSEFYLDRFFVIAKLQNYCALLYQQKTAGTFEITSESLALTLMAHIEDGKFEDEPLAILYYHAARLIKNPNDPVLSLAFDHLLETHKSAIHSTHYNNLKTFQRYFYHSNYLASGNTSILKGMFELLCTHLEAGYLHYSGKLLYYPLRNIVHYGLRLKAFEMVRSILEKYPPEQLCGTRHPVEAIKLLYAEYYLATKNFNACLDTIEYCHFENPNLRLQVDLLLVKVYFETENSLLDARMDALYQKIIRIKLAPELKKRYLHFLKLLESIRKKNWKMEKGGRQKLEKRISQLEGVMEREWLMAQLD